MGREEPVGGYIDSVLSGAQAADCAKMLHIYAGLHVPNIAPNL